MGKIKRTIGFIFTHPLSKKHLLKSIYRFILWQLQSGISPTKFIVKSYVQGVKFYARKGLTGVTGNIYTGLHEFDEMAFLLHFLNENDTFFDVGSNVGSYTLLASGVRGAKSIAIEPVKSTFDILTKNIELNKLQDKVSLINSGAGSGHGTLVFSSNEDTTNHVIAFNETNRDHTTEVPVITVDSLLTKTQPILIKIDVEGYETEVLKGMSQILASPSLKSIIIELNGSGARYGYNENQIHELLLINCFESYNYDPFTRTLTATSKFGKSNTLYCRDLAFINNRIKNARGVKIIGELI